MQKKVQDFSRILDWSVDDHNAAHQADLQWLREEVTRIRDEERSTTATSGDRSTRSATKKRKKIVVVTHHAPIRKGSSKPEHENNPWTDAFSTEILGPRAGGVANPPLDVDWWIFGHTHFTTSCMRGAVRLISNQRGYVFPGQQQHSVALGSLKGTGQKNKRGNSSSSVFSGTRKQPSRLLARLLRREEMEEPKSPKLISYDFDVKRSIDV